MTRQEINELRFEVYDRFCKSENEKDKDYNQKLMNIIDHAVTLRESMEKISKIGASHM